MLERGCTNKGCPFVQWSSVERRGQMESTAEKALGGKAPGPRGSDSDSAGLRKVSQPLCAAKRIRPWSVKIGDLDPFPFGFPARNKSCLGSQKSGTSSKKVLWFPLGIQASPRGALWSFKRRLRGKAKNQQPPNQPAQSQRTGSLCFLASPKQISTADPVERADAPLPPGRCGRGNGGGAGSMELEEGGEGPCVFEGSLDVGGFKGKLKPKPSLLEVRLL